MRRTMEMRKKSSEDRSTSQAVHLLYILGLSRQGLLQTHHFGTLTKKSTPVQA